MKLIGHKSWWVIFGAFLLCVNPVWGQDPDSDTLATDFPLQPPDTSSPQATMGSFINNMQEAHKQVLKGMALYKKEPGWYSSPAVEKEFDRAFIFINRATRCLDLSEAPPTLVERIGLEATVLLKTIFDRISIPPFKEIPTAEDMEVDQLIRWRVPNTEITITKVLKGPRAGEYLFSPTTVDRLGDFYELIKHLPHKPGGWVGVYKLYTEVSGEIIPDKLVFMLPGWAKIRYLNHPIWKWVLLGILLILTALVMLKVIGISRGHQADRPLYRVLYQILLPVSLMVMAYLLDFLQKDIGFRGEVSEGMTKIFLGLTYLGAGWTVLLIGSIVAESVISSPNVKSKGLDAAMIRVVSRIISFIISAGIIVLGAQTIGIPLAPILAGLGIGGLALALSAQATVENFIGGMTLFADRPVRLGEMCKFGDRMGIVEEIGLRSTRLRTLDRTVVTVPNAEFSKLHLENFTKRDKIWFHPRIWLRLDTTPDQLRYILVEIRKLLYAHPKVLRDPARIRFVQFGNYSLDLDIFAYINATDYGEYLEITEDLYLRMMEVVTDAGTDLAVPAVHEYTEAGEKLDEEQIRNVEEEVQAWRESNSLYLPKFPDSKIDELAGSLEYPPPGTPGKGQEGEVK